MSDMAYEIDQRRRKPDDPGGILPPTQESRSVVAPPAPNVQAPPPPPPTLDSVLPNRASRQPVAAPRSVPAGPEFGAQLERLAGAGAPQQLLGARGAEALTPPDMGQALKVAAGKISAPMGIGEPLGGSRVADPTGGRYDLPDEPMRDDFTQRHKDNLDWSYMEGQDYNRARGQYNQDVSGTRRDSAADRTAIDAYLRENHPELLADFRNSFTGGDQLDILRQWATENPEMYQSAMDAGVPSGTDNGPVAGRGMLPGEDLLRSRISQMYDDQSRGIDEFMASRGVFGSSPHLIDDTKLRAGLMNEYNQGLLDLSRQEREFGLAERDMKIRERMVELQAQGMSQDDAYRRAQLEFQQEMGRGALALDRDRFGLSKYMSDWEIVQMLMNMDIPIDRIKEMGFDVDLSMLGRQGDHRGQR